MAYNQFTGSFSGSGKSYAYPFLQVSSVIDIQSNISTVNYSLLVHKNITAVYTYKVNTPITITIDGQTHNKSINFDIKSIPAGGDYLVAEGSFSINHNADGKKTVECSATINLSSTSMGTGTVSGSFKLDDIPRYANATLWNTGEYLDSATFQYSVDAPYDSVNVHVYNSNNSLIQDYNIDIKESFEVASLSPNNKYYVEISVRRTGTTLYKSSNRVTITTKAISSISNNIDFTLGSNIPLKINNSSSSPMTLNVKVGNSNIWSSQIGDVSSYTINLNSTQISNMAKLIPNSTSGLYSIEIKVNSPLGNIYTSSKSGKFYINESNSAPIVSSSSISYSDRNNIASGNIIQHKSSLYITITGGSGTGKDGADIKTWNVNFNGVTKSSNFSINDVSFDFGVPSNAGNFNISFSAIDSRGIVSATVIKTITVHPYGNPTLYTSLSRVNGYEANVTLRINANVTSSSGFSNSIKTCTWSRSNGEVKNISEAIGKLSFDTSINNFDTPDIDNGYWYSFTITDQLDSKVSVDVFVPEGKPALIIAENGTVGIGSYVDDGYKCQIGGNIRIDGDVYINDDYIKHHALNNPVNSITSTDETLSLAASVGKVLSDNINTLSKNLVDNYYNKNNIDGKFMPKSGGTFTGNVSFEGDISARRHVKIAIAQKMIWDTGANIFSNNGQHLYFMGSNEADYTAHLGVHDGMWTFDPDVNGRLNLGTSNHKWGTIYAVNGTISTSDRNQKNTIKKLDNKYIELFSKLIPVSFKFNDGTSGRTHIGFIAQDVENAMKSVGLTDLDFAGFCKDIKTTAIKKRKTFNIGDNGTKTVQYYEDVNIPNEYIYSLRYEEFIALNTAMIQDLLTRVSLLENKIIHNS